MSDHTPGPWQLAPFNDDATDPLDVVSEYREIGGGRVEANWIAEVHLETDDAENLANARLIAAAPDLLALLKLLRDDWFEPHYGCNDVGYAVILRDHIRAAIAKAEGR